MLSSTGLVHKRLLRARPMAVASFFLAWTVSLPLMAQDAPVSAQPSLAPGTPSGAAAGRKSAPPATPVAPGATAETPAPTKLTEDKPVTAKKRINAGGRELAYTASITTILLKSDETKDGNAQGEKIRAKVFVTSYVLDDAKPAERPVMFVWNGGPGSASYYLHVGFMGPKRALLTDDGHAPAPPGALITNDETILKFADLVFIDPVGTGFSRVAPGEKPDRFFDTAADADEMADIIQTYVTRNGRWDSPKFLAGESYGALRLAKTAALLQSSRGLLLNGLVVISGAFNYQVLSPAFANDLPFPLFLPSYTAAAWYHKKSAAVHLAKPLRQVLDEVEQFASGDYQAMLFKGAKATAAERALARRRLAEFTGLSETYLDEANLRPAPRAFFTELLRAERKVIGRYDARYTAPNTDPAGPGGYFDPADANVVGPFRTALELVWRDEFGYQGDSEYRLYAFARGGQWNFDVKGQYSDAMPELQRALSANPQLKMFVAEGYFDLATAYAGVDYLLDHLADPDGSIKARTVIGKYMGGHMMYSVASERKALSADIGAFIGSVNRTQ